MRTDLSDLWSEKKEMAISLLSSKQEVPRYAKMQIEETVFLVCFVCILLFAHQRYCC